MKKWSSAFVIGFTYIGTVVGAGFATGQEILQFFTLYGKLATFTIFIASFLFIWLGIKMMLLASDIHARSYEDMNIHLFGQTTGRWVSALMLVLLLTITTVMLAGAGSVFREQFQVSYQSGLLITMLLAYAVITQGLSGIKTVNTIVVPLMLMFMVIILALTLQSPASVNFIMMPSDQPTWRILLSPFIYTAFNLALAQAVLVPLGASAEDQQVIRLGGWIGGIGITLLLLAGHIALSAHMPGIAQYDIPMGQIINELGPVVRFIFILLIFAEIFTTLIADIFGVMLQLNQHVDWNPHTVAVILLLFCYAVSQIGFKTLLSTLYPLLGLISLVWLVMLVLKRRNVI